ncbi:hypothetical protein ACOZDE_34110 [Streptomyces griseoincarnatus]
MPHWPYAQAVDEALTARGTPAGMVRVSCIGPGSSAKMFAAEADLLEDLPSVRLPDLAELRARGVLGPRTARTPAARRTLGAGGYPDTEPADTPG